jgi:arylsulfatase A-like enzyme
MRAPNFLLFVTDQQRADQLGCYGDPVRSTPHIDRLAAEGQLFEEFHVATPICQPNRASLMTGRLPSAHGVQMNGRELSFGERTFVQSLREAGYSTALVGKSHLQNITAVPPIWPAGSQRLSHDARQVFPGIYGQEVGKRWEEDPAFELTLPYYGFESVCLTIGHGDEQQGHWRRWLRQQTPEAEQLIGPHNAIPTPNSRLALLRQAWRTRLPEELYPTRYIADRTCDALTAQATGGQPFFIQCSFPDPHHPFTPPGRYWDQYQAQDMQLPESFHAQLTDPPPAIEWLRQARISQPQAKPGYGAFACDEHEAREAMALNHGSMACIDDAIGRVMSRLSELGLSDNTVVMFTSDHGELLGDRGLMFKGGLHYQALTRVPFIWRDTAEQRSTQQPGHRRQALAQTTDIAATVLARAGIGATHGMHGRSLLGLMTGSDSAVREHLLIEEESQRQDFGLQTRMRLLTLRTRRHRLTIYDGQVWGELYDLQEDPLELHNLWNDAGALALRNALALQMSQASLAARDTSPYPTASA